MDMTILERITEIINKEVDFCDSEPADFERMIYYAYYMGMEKGVHDISDKYNALIAEQNDRAKKCRYHKMAKEIIGDQDYIYDSNYRMEITQMFGGDPADI